MFDPHFRQSSVKGTDLSVADEFVCKLGSVVCLHRLYFESECFYKHLQELYAILRCMFFKCIDKAITSTFVYCRPLIQVLSVAPYCSSETIVRHFFDIYLYLFPRYQYFGIATILSPGSPLFWAQLSIILFAAYTIPLKLLVYPCLHNASKTPSQP